MLGNNNSKITNKISRRILKANKMRNIFTILAIALTTLLITVIITGGITFYNSYKTFNMISNYGVDSDGYINVTDESLDKLKEIDRVDKIGVAQLASTDTAKNKEFLNENIIIQSADKNTYDMMAIIPIEGNYPKKEDEVLVPTWVLDVLDVPNKVGEKISLDLVIGGEVKTFDFKLSGYYESLVSRGAGRTSIFVSQDFINKYSKEIESIDGGKVAYVNVKTLNENSTFEEAKDEMENLVNEIGATMGKAHPKYEDKGIVFDSNKIEQILVILVGILLMVFTGYLIIYNIFYISVSKDIRFYGLLKTIGTTSKQLKKIILKQALKLSIIGIPLGLILGYLIASFVLPLALKVTTFGNVVVVSKNPIIFLLATLFSLLTVIISCRKPGKIAGKVSPIEAVKFVSLDDSKSKKTNKSGMNGGKLHKMAWSSILKNKKRVTLSIISISLSSVIVIFTVNATLGMDPIAHAENQMVSDIEVNNNIGHFWGEEEYKPINQELIKKISDLEGVKEVTPLYSVIEEDDEGNTFGFGVDIILDGKFKEEINDLMESEKNYMWLSKIDLAKDLIRTEVVGLKSENLDKELEGLDVIDGKIDEEKLKTGNYLIYYTDSGRPINLKVGDILPLKFRVKDENGDSKEIKKEFEIMAIVSKNKKDKRVNNLLNLNIEEEELKTIFPNPDQYIKQLNIELYDGVDIGDMDKKITDILVKSENRTLGLLSKNYYIEGIKEMKAIFLIIGSILSLILGIIGVINIINTMLTSIFARKVEFAMLESIGMTKKQLKKMILFEGIYYIGSISILIIPLGFIVAFVAPMLLPPISGGFNLGVCLISILVALIIISILMITVPLIGYNLVSKESIVKRLRDLE